MSEPIQIDRSWQTGHASKVSAIYSSEHLTIVLEGEKPSPCHQLDVERSLLDVEPPSFTFRWRAEGACAQVMVPFRHSQTFFIGAPRAEVEIRMSSGTQRVAVQPRGPLRLDAASGGGDVPIPFGDADAKKAWASASSLDGMKPVEAVGYSDSWSFEEAFRAAVTNLPSCRPPHPDALTTIQVVATGAQIGGIAGLNRLFVKVRALTL